MPESEMLRNEQPVSLGNSAIRARLVVRKSARPGLAFPLHCSSDGGRSFAQRGTGCRARVIVDVDVRDEVIEVQRNRGHGRRTDSLLDQLQVAGSEPVSGNPGQTFHAVSISRTKCRPDTVMPLAFQQ